MKKREKRNWHDAQVVASTPAEMEAKFPPKHAVMTDQVWKDWGFKKLRVGNDGLFNRTQDVWYNAELKLTMNAAIHKGQAVKYVLRVIVGEVASREVTKIRNEIKTALGLLC